MSVSLSKGQRVDLTKGRPSLKNIFVGLGWDINHYDGEADFDLDASAFMTKANGKVGSDGDFIFYGNLAHSSKSVVHMGDNRTGEELMRFDLSEDFSTETALVVAEIYRHNGEWKFKAVGGGYSGGLKSLCSQYGIDAE